MLKVALLVKRTDGKYKPVDTWYEDELVQNIDQWLKLHYDLGYEDIEECSVTLVGSEIIPDRVFMVESSLYALKQEGIVKVRRPR